MSQPKIPSDGPQLMGSRDTGINSGPAAPALARRELVPGPGQQASGRGSRPGIGSGIRSGVRRETARGGSQRVALELPWPGPESQPVLLKAWAWTSATGPHPSDRKAPPLCGRPQWPSRTDTGAGENWKRLCSRRYRAVSAAFPGRFSEQLR